MSEIAGTHRPPRRGVSWRPGPVLLGLLALLAGLLVVLGLLLGDRFFNATALRSMAYQLPELGVLSLAMMIPLLSGGLDLSIIAVADLSALAMGFVLTHFADSGQLVSCTLALLAGFGVAGCVGLLNGLVIAFLGVSPILATLGTMTLVKGISIGLTHGEVISGFAPFIVAIGNDDVFGIPIVLILFAAIALPVAVLLAATPFGTIVAMIGSNERAVRYSGIDTRRVILRIYLISALLAAGGGLLMMARFNSANATYGESYLLVTILAAVLGGIDPNGGFGKVSGLVLALIILQVVSTAANLLDISQFLTLALWGAILLGVAGVGRLRAFVIPMLRRPSGRAR